jgi:hypothetical protein
MSESQSSREALQHGDGDEQELEYPTNRMVAVLDTADQTSCALDALVAGGFLESEIVLSRGMEDADRLGATTGRSGLSDLWIRTFQRLGLENAEVEMKDRYEQALRDGHTIIVVLALTEERKSRAAEVLRNCGGHFINFFSRLAVERITA